MREKHILKSAISLSLVLSTPEKISREQESMIPIVFTFSFY